MSGPALGARDTAVNNTDKSRCPHGADVLVEGDRP